MLLRHLLVPRSVCLTLVALLTPAVAIPAWAQAEVETETETEAAPVAEVVLKLAEPTDTDESAEQTESAPETDAQTKALQEQIKQLKLEAQLRTAQLEAELASAKAENQRLQQAYESAKQQQRDTLQPLELEKAQIDLELGLAKAKRTAEHAPLDAELAVATKEQALREAKLAAELAELSAAVKKLQAEQALAGLERKAELAEAQHRQMLLTTQNEVAKQELLAERLAAEAAQAQALAELNVAQVSLKQLDAERQLDNTLGNDLEYPAEPFVDGVLTISDRRIALNGPIITGTADYVTERIHFFNNADAQAPIFLVIDNCPGGSVMQGYRIVKAIEASDAPVHIVVKSFAASMAAIITTLADHSYAYPNAVILHHQMSAGMRGNMAEMQDTLETMQEWAARLANPVAEKMGVTPERFVELMYENDAAGDWEEFADRAVELKWVNTIVRDIREQGVRKRPTESPRVPWYSSMFAQDERGRTYINLPPLEPMDAYVMYNPNNFYRVDGR